MPGQTGDITDSMSPLQMQVMDTDPNSPQYADLQQQLYTQQWMQAFNNNDPGTMGLIETEETLAQTQQAIRNHIPTDGFVHAPDDLGYQAMIDRVDVARMGIGAIAAYGLARRAGASEANAMESANWGVGVEMGFAGKAAEEPTVEFTGEASEGGVGSLEQMRAYYAAQDPDYDFTRSTFTTLGVDSATARDYLDTEQGQGLLDALQNAAPNDDYDTILARAMDALGSGTTLPNVQSWSSSLVKVVPEGQELDPYSGYLTTWEVLNNKPEGMTLADYLGLPSGSEAPNYNVFELSPLHSSATVYMSTVAPAIDSNGLIQRQGGALQYFVPNRAWWTNPQYPSGTISN
jgi:hypothetical protein